MADQTQPVVVLNDGASMPQFGLGVFQTPPETTAQVVREAVESGYRAVDTAAMYATRRASARRSRAGLTFSSPRNSATPITVSTKRCAHSTRADGDCAGRLSISI